MKTRQGGQYFSYNRGVDSFKTAQVAQIKPTKKKQPVTIGRKPYRPSSCVLSFLEITNNPSTKLVIIIN